MHKIGRINNKFIELIIATIKYNVDGGLSQYQVWNGTLSQNETDTILLSGIAASGISHTFSAKTINPNNATDINLQNDEQIIAFNSQYGNQINLKLVTDNYGLETSWKLLDSNFNEIDAGRSITQMQLVGWENGVGSRLYTIKEPDQERAKLSLNIPEEYHLTAVVGFGYPIKKVTGKKERKEIDEIVSYNKFGTPIEI